MYPKLTDKEMEHLPEVFKEIIAWDEKDPRQQKVVSLEERDEYLARVEDWKHNRNNLTAGAQNFVKKQRGGSGNSFG